MTQKRSQVEFEEMVKEISGGAYEVMGKYVDALTKIHIRCNVCGFKFKMRPSRFLEGGRCKMCKKLRRLGLFDFVVSRKPLFRVMIVDDDTKVLDFCKESLDPTEFEVTTISEGQKALKKFEKDPYDLMIVDLLMPEVDGLQILIRLKDKYKNINIMTMTEVNKYPEEFKKLFYSTKKIGAVDIIEKPFTAETLIKKVRAVLTEKHDW
ncbi:MAG: hypothetical protein COA79_24700 [Planctomycetota bacterium]|nr:MAG: hypothetical protein COA79_24700 [Planctomycetota bacterium]